MPEIISPHTYLDQAQRFFEKNAQDAEYPQLLVRAQIFFSFILFDGLANYRIPKPFELTIRSQHFTNGRREELQRFVPENIANDEFYRCIVAPLLFNLDALKERTEMKSGVSVLVPALHVYMYLRTKIAGLPVLEEITEPIEQEIRQVA